MRKNKTLLALLLVAALCLPPGASAFVRPAGPPAPTVIARMTPAAYQLASNQVASAIDYGGFVWVEMTPAQAVALQQAGVPFEPQPQAAQIGLLNYPFDTRLGEPAIPANLRTVETVGQAGLHLVQLVGPTKDEWLKDLESTGLLALQYVPENAYLVWGTPEQVASAKAAPSVRWTGAFHPAYKIASSLTDKAGLIENVNVLVYDDGRVKETLAAIEALGGRYVQDFPMPVLQRGQLVDAIFALDATRLGDVARIPNVFHLDYASPKSGLDDEVANQIIVGNNAGGVPFTGYQSWLTAHGVNGSGVIFADVDTGCDTNVSSTAHQDIRGRIAAFVDYTGGAHSTDDDGHGTHTAGIIAGNATLGDTDTNGFLFGLGMAPSAQIVAQNALWSSAWPPSGGWQRMSKDSVLNSAVGSSNSWYTGATGAQGYSAACVTHDKMVRDANFDTTTVAEPLIMVFSAGNSGPGSSTMTEPHESKNLIVVGASENYRLDNPLGSGCGASANIENIVSFSSRGPCLDGRLAPTVSAPGSDVASLRSYTGSYSGCGLPVSGHSDYVYMSGTSMACPQVSGAVTLITQWWKGFNAGTVPSPAMAKALLVNGATDMGTADIPNNNEGWGRVNLDNVIQNGASMIYRDQQYLFTNSGQTWTLAGGVANASKPLKITLAWTDAPGVAGGNAWVNNLDLEVTVGGVTYKGNVFASGWSTAGGSADYRNNVECVYIQNPGAGAVTVKVIASNIAGDGVPYNGDTTDQDFALVVYNMVQNPDFTISATPEKQDICAPQVVNYTVPVGVIMGYSQTVALTLGNVPASTPYAFTPASSVPPFTSTLVLTTTAGTPDGAYTLVITGTAETTRTHTAQVKLVVNHNPPPAPTLTSPADGASSVPLRPTFAWSDVSQASTYRLQVCTDPVCASPVISVSGLTTHTYTAPAALAGNTCYFWRVAGDNACGAGAFSAVSHFETVKLFQAFWDDMESGAGKWTHQATQGTDAWAISTAQSHSPTHAWFVPDDSVATDSRLWNTLPIALGSGTGTLTFWHRYNFEGSGTSAWDGAVLEISTDGGATWNDLQSYITANGYNGTIRAGSANPLAGRSGWTADLTTWTQVEVDLSSFAGGNVLIRWRLGCDGSVSDTGWYIDDVEVITSPPPNSFSQDQCLFVGVPAHFTATATGTYTYTWDFGGPGNGTGLKTATPVFTYTAPGSYVVELNLESACTTEAITREVFVCGQVVQNLDFTVSPNPRSNAVVTFTATATGTAPIVYTWNFGDGQVGSGSTATHTYAAGGNYTVTVNASNCTGCGSAQAMHSVAVCDSVHNVNFSASRTPALLNQVVTFTASALGTAPIAYTWDFGDGYVAAGAVVTHVYTATGSYNVSLAATNCAGAQAQVQQLVNVCDPVHDLVLTPPTAPRPGVFLAFTASATGTLPIAYAWTFGDGGTASGPSVTHRYLASGNYTVTVTASNCTGALARTATSIFVCDSVHGASFSVSADPAAVNQVVTFTATALGTTPLTYAWDFGDGHVGAGAAVTHAYTTTGNYSVTLVVANCVNAQVSVVQTVHVVEYKIYLPLVIKDAS